MQNRRLFSTWLTYLRAMAKWLAVSLVTGVLCGAVGAVFHIGVHRVTELRAAQPWLLYTLPLLGVVIVWLYKRLGTEGQSTNDILNEIHSGYGVSLALLPAIFFATLLTHLGGGSVGREGAALQMGGAIGYQSGRLLHLDDSDLRTMTTIGMAAFFSALFGTPMAAAVFALEITTVGRIYFAQLFPCLVAALTACGVSMAFGVEPTAFSLAVPQTDAVMLVRVAVLAMLGALLSVVFCEVIHATEHAAAKLTNPYLRIVVGGALVVVLTLLLGTTDYNGAGMDVITRAVEQGQAVGAAFALKLVFTALSLAAGYKGGEVVPSFFVGATFGCVVAPVLGIPAAFGAAVGLIAVFCGAVNCPLASTFLALELFGGAGLPYFALTCAISFVLSGYSGIYASQRILYNKLKTDYPTEN
ncbi:MAG: chloride channel protein [Oscillospiraceae bacterium]|nr:chloride channel protein [Oscillospiraceae bacterium]